MCQSKFTETQIVSILKEADAGRPVNEIWRSCSISSATYEKWKTKYGDTEARSSTVPNVQPSWLISEAHYTGPTTTLANVLFSN
jgi:hypothetical protein